MQNLNTDKIRQEHEAWETEMDLLLEIRRRQMEIQRWQKEIRENQRYNELMAFIGWMVMLGCVCAAWYFRNV